MSTPNAAEFQQFADFVCGILSAVLLCFWLFSVVRKIVRRVVEALIEPVNIPQPQVPMSAKLVKETPEEETKSTTTAMEPDESFRVGLPKVEEMKKLIECPVCLDIPLPPIYLCRRGHIVCNSCQARTASCPLCRDVYTNTRSFVAEGIVESCLVKCKYREQGCPDVFSGGELSAHLKVCDYRPLRCSECRGNWIVYGEYWNHLLMSHGINGLESDSGDVMFNLDFSLVSTHYDGGIATFLWPPYYFKCFGEIFLLKVHGLGRQVCAYVSILGPKASAAKYYAQIDFASAHKEKFRVTWEGKVNHFRDEPIEAVFNKGLALVLPLEVVEANSIPCGPLQSWAYHVIISEKDSRTVRRT